MSTTNSNNKRPLSTEDTSLCNSDHPPKRQKLNERDAVNFTSKLYDITQDDRINDIEFTIKNDDETEIICGLKAFFAAHSEVFKSMLYNGNMQESQTNKVTIDDVTITAFKFIKDYTHFANPELKYEHVIDILYTAQKYMITNLIQKCKDKVFSMSNLDQFYSVTTAINKYSSSAFESLFKDISIQQFVSNNVIKILDDNRSQSLSISQMQELFQLVGLVWLRYVNIKKYCKSCSTEWKSIFQKHFKHLVNFDLFNINQLVNEVALDEILEFKTLLSLIDAKIKKTLATKNGKIKRLKEKNAKIKKTLATQNRKLRAQHKALQSKYDYESSSDHSYY